jgi:hypothetical protein
MLYSGFFCNSVELKLFRRLLNKSCKETILRLLRFHPEAASPEGISRQICKEFSDILFNLSEILGVPIGVLGEF